MELLGGDLSMSDRITDQKLYMKLYNHNAWSDQPLDIDSLGAGGSRNHLVFFNTQNYLGPLMTNSQLWDLLGAIGTYEYQTKRQRKTPVKVWLNEYERIQKKGEKIDYGFTYKLQKTIKPTIKHPIGSRFKEVDN